MLELSLSFADFARHRLPEQVKLADSHVDVDSSVQRDQPLSTDCDESLQQTLPASHSSLTPCPPAPHSSPISGPPALSPHSVSILSMFVPNILNPRARHLAERGVKLDPAHLSAPDQRLALLGGLSGILSHMAADGTEPNIKTFSLLLSLLPGGDTAAEFDLLAAMETRGVKVNVDLLNLLIRRRTRQWDQQGVQVSRTTLLVYQLPDSLLTLSEFLSGLVTCLSCDSFVSLVTLVSLLTFFLF